MRDTDRTGISEMPVRSPALAINTDVVRDPFRRFAPFQITYCLVNVDFTHHLLPWVKTHSTD